jgi:hypothetical protein
MQPEGSIPNSQELSACPYPEPDQSIPYHPIPPLQDPPTYVLVFLVVSCPLAFPPTTYIGISLLVLHRQEMKFRDENKPLLKLVMDPRGQVQDLNSLRRQGYNIEPGSMSPEVAFDLVRDLNAPKGKGKHTPTGSAMVLSLCTFYDCKMC